MKMTAQERDGEEMGRNRKNRNGTGRKWGGTGRSRTKGPNDETMFRRLALGLRCAARISSPR